MGYTRFETTKKVAFYDLEGQFSLPFVVDGDRFDALELVGDDRVDVLVDVNDDDETGVAMPVQVHSVCRRTL